MEEATQESGDSTSKASDIQAVERAAHILALFGSEFSELTVPIAAVRLGLNRTTVHRYFTSLLGAGLLGRGVKAGTFVPGPLAVQLGAFALGRQTVLDLAERHLRELSEVFRMSAVLSLWGSRGPVVAMVREDRSGPVLITVPVGTQLSIDTAQSVLFLAHASDQLEAQRLLGVLPADIRGQIGAHVDQARRDGLATRAFADGITTLAGPVFGPDGITATLALIHTSAMLSADIRSVQAIRLRDAAAELSKELGGVGPTRTVDLSPETDGLAAEVAGAR